VNIGLEIKTVRNLKYKVMKKLRLRKAGFVGLILIMISTLTYGQKIETQYRQNLENAKEKNGTEFFEDGTVKVKVNTKMIEQFYNAYDNNKYLSWRELINSSDKESLAAFWSTYRNANLEESDLAEIKKELDKKYSEIAEKRSDQNVIVKTMLAEKRKKMKK
jgi:hypothetical protein